MHSQKVYDLIGKRGIVIRESGKQRITILLDTEILTAFREHAAGTGRGYQSTPRSISRSGFGTIAFRRLSFRLWRTSRFG